MKIFFMFKGKRLDLVEMDHVPREGETVLINKFLYTVREVTWELVYKAVNIDLEEYKG